MCAQSVNPFQISEAASCSTVFLISIALRPNRSSLVTNLSGDYVWRTNLKLGFQGGLGTGAASAQHAWIVVVEFMRRFTTELDAVAAVATKCIVSHSLLAETTSAERSANTKQDNKDQIGHVLGGDRVPCIARYMI